MIKRPIPFGLIVGFLTLKKLHVRKVYLQLEDYVSTTVIDFDKSPQNSILMLTEKWLQTTFTSLILKIIFI